ncbi:MAG: GNAT family N-acetyltransferase [Candidatus Nanoarchaeia archaeon]|jgi:GNAT superfamily N-acetyltransferase
MLKIRYAIRSDIPFILQGIREVCKIEMEKPDKKPKLIRLINKAMKKKEIRVVTQDGKTAGFVQFQFTRKSPYGIEYGDYGKSFCWIDWMYVAKKFRRSGIGNALHNEIRRICKNRRVSEIMLDVFHVNESARKFYTKEGFSEFIHILKEKIRQ